MLKAIQHYLVVLTMEVHVKCGPGPRLLEILGGSSRMAQDRLHAGEP